MDSFGTKRCPNKKKYYGTCTVNRSIVNLLKKKFSSWEKNGRIRECSVFSLFQFGVPGVKCPATYRKPKFYRKLRSDRSLLIC